MTVSLCDLDCQYAGIWSIECRLAEAKKVKAGIWGTNR